MNRVVTVFSLALMLGVSLPAAAGTIYVNEAAFIAASGPLGFESFEGLVATNSVAGGFSRVLPAFTLSATNLAGVFDSVDYLGTHATDGTKYVEVEGATGQKDMTFLFGSPINEFGLTISDYGDFGSGPLVFSTNGGGSGTAASFPGLDANDKFFGFIDPLNPFTSITLSTTPPGAFGDPFSVDRVRFGATSAAPTVPEPASLALLGSGLALAVRRLRSRRR